MMGTDVLLTDDEYDDWLERKVAEGFHDHNRVDEGGEFLFDGSDESEVLWGSPDEILWASGETLMLVGPTGVGKSTLAGQLVEALLGITSDVLDRKVRQVDRVLYLAMDRPKQIRRAFKRLFTPEQRKQLSDVYFHIGPLKVQLANDPLHLLNLAKFNNANVIVVDSMKDLARDLNDPKTGSDINAAFQHCLAEGIEVIVLHHLRKTTGKTVQKPKSVEDVFGSAVITWGIGSIILLWGQPGSTVVELSHLKPLHEPVGPWTVQHDHMTGRSNIQAEFNLLQFIRGSKTYGATTLEAAQERYGNKVKSGDANYKRMDRQLKNLLEAGCITQDSPDGTDSTGLFTTRRYWAVDPVDSLLPP